MQKLTSKEPVFPRRWWENIQKYDTIFPTSVILFCGCGKGCSFFVGIKCRVRQTNHETSEAYSICIIKFSVFLSIYEHYFYFSYIYFILQQTETVQNKYSFSNVLTTLKINFRRSSFTYTHLSLRLKLCLLVFQVS